jgi:hypothetical protein
VNTHPETAIVTENHLAIPEPDPAFFENQQKFPQEELAKYYGQYVAWCLDGTRILASAADMEAVEQKLVALGIDPAAVVGSYVMPDDVSLLL